MLSPVGHGAARATAEATVLVIDDDPSMRDILNLIAHQHGFTLQYAVDGADGLRIAEQTDVDLILLDLTLPGLPGFDVCRRLRAAGIEVPIIMVSASTDTVDVVVGLEIGADDYISKPFEIRELAARINAKLRRQRTTQAQVRPGRLKFPGLVVGTSTATWRPSTAALKAARTASSVLPNPTSPHTTRSIGFADSMSRLMSSMTSSWSGVSS